VDFVIDTFPTYQGMEQIDGLVRDFKYSTGYAPETSGGLLISLPEENVESFIGEMEDQNENAWVVGRVVNGNRNAKLDDNLVILDVV
jgi:nitrogen regulatory protein PII-like uncharacterized protein